MGQSVTRSRNSFVSVSMRTLSPTSQRRLTLTFAPFSSAAALHRGRGLVDLEDREARRRDGDELVVDVEALVALRRPVERVLGGRDRAAHFLAGLVVEDLFLAIAVGVREVDLFLVEHFPLRVGVLLQFGHAARLQVLDLHLHERAAVVAQDVPPDHGGHAAFVADEGAGTEFESGDLHVGVRMLPSDRGLGNGIVGWKRRIRRSRCSPRRLTFGRCPRTLRPD
jgi:hypothetical protein